MSFRFRVGAFGNMCLCAFCVADCVRLVGFALLSSVLFVVVLGIVISISVFCIITLLLLWFSGGSVWWVCLRIGLDWSLRVCLFDAFLTCGAVYCV